MTFRSLIKLNLYWAVWLFLVISKHFTYHPVPYKGLKLIKVFLFILNVNTDLFSSHLPYSTHSTQRQFLFARPAALAWEWEEKVSSVTSANCSLSLTQNTNDEQFMRGSYNCSFVHQEHRSVRQMFRSGSAVSAARS